MTDHRLCILHTMDPRGQKVGGIETHIRLLLSRRPDDMKVLFVGVDEAGDREIGRVAPIEIGGRSMDFLPVLRIPREEVNGAARRLAQSVTLRFALGALRHLGSIRRAVGEGSASLDFHRMELASIPKLLRLPSSLMLHVEGAKARKEDSLLQRFPTLSRFNEMLATRLADHIFCVSPAILERVAARGPAFAGKAELLTVSIDTRLFRPAPQECEDGIFRLLYAGRLDEQKNPALMFATVERLAALLGRRLEFHYAGGSDPARYPEFAAIDALTTRHGVLSSAQVAELTRRCHAGILTSHFEGMPCFLLETLATGRPFAAIRLPQYDPVLRPGLSGRMIEPGSDAATTAGRLAGELAALWADIRAGDLPPQAMRALVEPYTAEAQMHKLFERHRILGRGRGAARQPAAGERLAPTTSQKTRS